MSWTNDLPYGSDPWAWSDAQDETSRCCRALLHERDVPRIGRALHLAYRRHRFVPWLRAQLRIPLGPAERGRTMGSN